MDPQSDAQEDQIIEESNPELEPHSDDSASDKDGDEDAAAEPGDDIVDETVTSSPKKIRTRSKSKQVLPEPIICSDPEDEEPRPRQRKRTHANATPLRAGGTSKYFRRLGNLNQFPSIASKTLAARKARAGNRGRK